MNNTSWQASDESAAATLAKLVTPEQQAAITAAKQASWDREYRSDVAVYVIYDQQKRRVLMEWRTPPWPPCNLWCFGSGRVDPGEAPQHAAERELREELDLMAHHIEPLGTIFDQSGRAFHPYLVTAWIGDVPTENADEGYPLGWFRLDRLPSVINDVTRAVAQGVRDHLAGLEAAGRQIEPVA